MFGKCDNCKRNNYLTEFEVTEKIKWHVCNICFKLLARAKLDAQLQKIKVDLNQELRMAFGKVGEE